MTEEIEPHILKKYEIVEKLGKGAYGIVWKAVDRKLKQVVALKKVKMSPYRCSMRSTTPQTRREPFEKSCFSKNSMVIVQPLRTLEHNTTAEHHQGRKQQRSISSFRLHGNRYFLCDLDLHVVIRAGILEEIHKKFVVYQLLKALKYMHSG